MGLKDHVEDVTGRILTLGLDLDYLHVEGTEWQPCLGVRAGSGYEKAQCSELEADMCAQGNSSTHSNSSSSNCSIISSTNLSSSIYSNCSEESTLSDSDEEQDQSESQNLHHHQDFTSDSQGKARHQSPREYSSTETNDPSAEYRNKVDFALKLGYSEELVLLVLKKLGPDALINDVLGELVKLGTRTEPEHQAGGSLAVSSSLSSPPPSFSTSSLGSCRLLWPSVLLEDKENLRPVVVDGSNVAMSHGNKEVFSCQGIQLAVDWFLERGHSDITVFVPAWRKEQSRPDALITDQEILRHLEKEKNLVFTPSRRVQGRRVVCYDDRFIVKLAYESDGIIVSNDNYRDLANEKPEWKKFIDERLLMYSFVNDKFMPPDDPLGRHGPSLENFLRKRPTIPEHRKQPCPYGKKCTYGNKCKFFHPERGCLPQRSVADELRASARSSSASKCMLGDTVMGISQPEGPANADACRGPQNTQCATSTHRYTFNDFLEERPGVRIKGECRRESNSRNSSSYSSSGLLGPSAPWRPLSSESQERRDHFGMGDTSGALGASQNGVYPTCVSAELRYSSMLKDYFFSNEPRTAVLLPSDYSREGSVTSDSSSPDPLLEDTSSTCRHYHQQCSNTQFYPQHSSRLSPFVCQHTGHGYSLLQVLTRQGDCDPPPMQPFPHCFKPSLSYLPHQLKHATPHNRSGYTGKYSAHASTPRPQTHSQNATLGCDLAGFSWLPQSKLYEGSQTHTRRDFPSPDQTQHLFTSWDLCYQKFPQPCYQPLQSFLEDQDWGQNFHSSLSGLNKAHQPSGRQHLVPPTLSQHQELRDQVFVNLCNIFPQELVRVVMGRNPYMDAQQLAAAILSEKSLHALK